MSAALLPEIASDPTQTGHVQTTTDILRTLVGFDTTSHKSNLELISWVEDYLASHGVSCERVPSDDGLKASLFATIGPAGTSGLGLSGHTDVVPVTGQEWRHEPFELTHEGTRLYGRGTCDMKGFLACCLAHVPRFKNADLVKPIHLLFSYDEEVGCTGVRPMIAELGERLIKPHMIIVGEPTSMRVVDAHKGATRFEVRITGREAHSSMAHLGVNSIRIAGELIGELGRMEDELKQSRNERFTPPYSTIQVGMIEGGQAPNIVPNKCQFVWDVRSLPGLKPDDLANRLRAFAETVCLPAMHKIDPDTAIEITAQGSIPSFQCEPDEEIVPLAFRFAQQNDLEAVSYGTEAGLFVQGGCPSIICGPGDIAQAHAADEFIDISQLVACSAFLDRVTQWCSE